MIHAILVNGDSKGLPKVEIQPGELQPIDFYFPFPPHKDSTQDLPEFDFHWVISAGTQKIRRITPFDRVLNSPCHTMLYPYGRYPLGWGTSWWWRPY
ncbi:MAG: hypothetical protein ABIQ95_06925 [Bdellovibrionia bacterium]